MHYAETSHFFSKAQKYAILNHFRTVAFRDFCRFWGNIYLCSEENGRKGLKH